MIFVLRTHGTMFKYMKVWKSSFFCPMFYSAYFHRAHLQFSCPMSIGLLPCQWTNGKLLFRSGTGQTGTSYKGFITKTRDCPVLPSLPTSLFREIPKTCSERCLPKYFLMFKNYLGPKWLQNKQALCKEVNLKLAFLFLKKRSSSKLQVVESLFHWFPSSQIPKNIIAMLLHAFGNTSSRMEGKLGFFLNWKEKKIIIKTPATSIISY